MTFQILAISGSLRRDSFNTSALRAAAGLLPEGVDLSILTLAGIPLFNADDEARDGFPPAVAQLRSRIAECDGLLIATPEYNYSISGALKNAIDWASRPPDPALTGKPAAILGAGGRLGTARAQMHLRQILLHNDVPLVGRPEVFIDRAAAFDEDGALTDERARNQIERLISALLDLIKRYA